MTGFVHPEFLVETDWLARHLQEVVVLDCTTHLIPDPRTTYIVRPGREEFEQGHIPGAQFCDVSRDVSDTSQKLNFMRPPTEDFAAAMRRFGISNDTKVITYSTSNAWWATRVWWLLREFGHDNAAVLNGGRQKWTAENRELQPVPPRLGHPAASPSANSRPDGGQGSGESRHRRCRDLHVERAAARPARRHRRQQLRPPRPHRRQRQRAGGASARSRDKHVSES